MKEPTTVSGNGPAVVHTVRDLRAVVHHARAAGSRIGLVPTMGALHKGHLSLVRAAQRESDFRVVTIFVNPTQFVPGEDLDRYPRTLDADVALLRQLAVNVVFAPDAREMYPAGFSTYIDPPAVAKRWEGECRPGHFRGVATVVMKLFQQTLADVAFFGQKDYQQAQVIRRMVHDLDVPTGVYLCPTVREPDGLAMSSRNRYLSPTEREQALSLSRGLQTARQMVAGGERNASRVVAAVRDMLLAAGVTNIDYVAVTDPESLEPVRELRKPAQLLIAASVGTTRLIDNCRLEGSVEPESG